MKYVLKLLKRDLPVIITPFILLGLFYLIAMFIYRQAPYLAQSCA